MENVYDPNEEKKDEEYMALRSFQLSKGNIKDFNDF